MGLCCSSLRRKSIHDDGENDPLLSNISNNTISEDTESISNDEAQKRMEQEVLQSLVQHATEKFLDISTLRAIERSSAQENITESYSERMQTMLDSMANSVWNSSSFVRGTHEIQSRDMKWLEQDVKSQKEGFDDKQLLCFSDVPPVVISWNEGKA